MDPAWIARVGCFARCALVAALAGGCGGVTSVSQPDEQAGGAEPHAAWARSVASPQTSTEFDAVATDGSSGVYVAGALWGPGSVDFGNGVTATAESEGYDAILVKYDASGAPLWAQAVAAGAVHSGFGAVSVDPDGSVYVTGDLEGSAGTADFGNGVVLTKSDALLNGVLVKYDAAGRAQWAELVTGGDGYSSLSCVTVDAAGNVYAVGEVEGTGTFSFGNGIEVTGVAPKSDGISPATSAILVEYDAAGTAQWARTLVAGGPGSSFSSVRVNAAGDVLVAGGIGGTESYDFGNGVTVAGTTSGGPVGGEPGRNALLVKYDASGNARWARSTDAGEGGSGFAALALDAEGNVYAAGSIGDGSYDFGGGVVATGSVKGGSFTGTAGPVFLVLAKYDDSGTARWARTVTPGGSSSYLTSVEVDAAGSVYVAGAVDSTGTYDFGSGVTVPTGTKDGGYYAAVVKYDASGAAEWAKSPKNGGTSEDILTSISLDADGDLYAAGLVSGDGPVDFGNDVLIQGTATDAGGGWSPLLLKYE
jgi:outer membrane protein assembly factor BamB